MNSSPHSECDPLNAVLDELLARFRQGERPPLKEFTERYPDLAERIREVVPALVMMEELGSVDGAATGPLPGDLVQVGEPPGHWGEYRILREVGRGGMGVVYEAVQESLGRHVALKILTAGAARHRTYLERFRREARAAARLHHTNIVPVYSVGEIQGTHYYAMQFIHGRSLDVVLKDLRHLRGRPTEGGSDATATVDDVERSIARSLLTGQFAPGLALAPTASETGSEPHTPSTASQSELIGQSEAHYFRGVARLGVQAAEALAHAHAQGVLHRDIKPSNLLFDTQGTLWVADFGLAKADDSDDLTNTGDIVGTLRYMAPERFQGRADARSDVYSLGMTLYEMLTLKPAFADSDRARLIERVTHAVPPRPRQLNQHIPKDLETIVLKAIARDPADRYAVAETLAEDLRRFLADRPILARRSPAVERLRRWCRRNPMVATLSGAVAALLVVLAVGSLVAALQLSDQRADLRHQLRQTQRAEREGQEKLLQAQLAQARAARFGGQVGQRFASLDALAEGAAIARDLDVPEERLLELRNEAVACLALADLRHPSVPYHLSAGSNDGLWFDDSFERYAVADAQGQVIVRGLDDDRELLRIPGQGIPLEDVRFSPDGRSLVLNTRRAGYERGSCQFWNLETRTKTLQLPGNVMSLTADSRQAWIWLSLEKGELELYDLPTGRKVQQFAVGPGWHAFAFHPDGRQLAESGEKHAGVNIWDSTTGKLVRTVAASTRSGVIAWHPGGRFLAISASEDTIETWDVERGRRQAVMRGHQTTVGTVVFNHGGDLLASTGWDPVLRLWDPLTGKLLLSKEVTVALKPQFNRDDRLLGATLSGSQWELWEVTRGGAECRSLAGPPGTGGISSADFSMGGRLLAWCGAYGVHLWDRTTNRELAFLNLGDVPHLFFDQADGSLITCGRRGVERWPIASVPPDGKGDDSLVLKIGPPRSLHPPGHLRQADLSADGARLVVSDLDHSQGFVVDPRDPAGRIILNQPHLAHIALSPDGRWVATGTYIGGPAAVVKIWDAGSGAFVRNLDVGGDAIPVFSGDGRWLAAGTGREFFLWRVGTWEQARVIQRDNAAGSGLLAFSPDGRLLAVAHSNFLVQLLNLDTGQEVASLAVRDPQRVHVLRFSPDGSQLVAGRENQEAQVWDLRLIGRRLAEMGLDQGWPSFPPPAAAASPPPIRITVDLGPGPATPQKLVERWTAAIRSNPEDVEAYHYRGHAYEQLGLFAKAVADFSSALKFQPENAHFLERRGQDLLMLRQFEPAVADLEHSLAIQPDQAEAANNLAWIYVTGPANLRDPDKALPLAERAASLAPQQSIYLNTLGVAQYRSAMYSSARATLERSLQASAGGWDAFDLYFLALCHHHLDDPAKAKECYERAVKWQAQANLPGTHAEELNAFRAEAAKELGLPPPPDP
jgi:serine/threonine protein kinase/WD40 repeat protein/Tfp pilus assembly protein PilF